MKLHLEKLLRPVRALPAAGRLRPDRPAAAALARTSQASRRSARQPQRQSRHPDLERAHAYHRPPERALSRSDAGLPQPRSRNHRLRQSRRHVARAARTAAPKSEFQRKPRHRSQPPHRRPRRPTSTLCPQACCSENPAAEVTYAVEILNRNARGAGLSNRVHVPAVVTLPPPAIWPRNSPATASCSLGPARGELPRRRPRSNIAIESIGARRPRAKELRQRCDCRRSPPGRARPRAFHRLQLRVGKDLPLPRHRRDHPQAARQRGAGRGRRHSARARRRS